MLNAGVASLKYALFSVDGQEFLRGHIVGVGRERCVHQVKVGHESFEEAFRADDHVHAIMKAVHFLSQNDIAHKEAIVRVGHRIVHGGEEFTEPTIVSDKVLARMKELASFAPTQSMPGIGSLLSARSVLPDAQHVAVFDTAFHHTIPKEAFLYGIPYDLYEQHGIRKFGFHGISHAFVAQKAAGLLKGRKLHVISCHLGNGSSITAIRDGVSVDTSMGFAPLDGVIMGTRSGELDPQVVLHMISKLKYTPRQLHELLENQSGLKGIAGTGDVRELWERSKAGDGQARLALDMLSYRVAKYIGGYAAACHGVDAIVFTGGVGEHAYYVRKQACAYLQHLGVVLDAQANRQDEVIISAPKSQVKVLVIPTDEERAILESLLAVQRHNL